MRTAIQPKKIDSSEENYSDGPLGLAGFTAQESNFIEHLIELLAETWVEEKKSEKKE